MDTALTAPSTSIAALKTAPINSLKERVLEVIESYGADGCITDDVIEAFRKRETTNTGQITGRFSELEADGLMVRIGDKRRGASGKQQLVMRHHSFVTSVPPIFAKPAKKNPFVSGLIKAARVIADVDPTFKGSPAAKALRKEIMKVARR